MEDFGCLLTGIAVAAAGILSFSAYLDSSEKQPAEKPQTEQVEQPTVSPFNIERFDKANRGTPAILTDKDTGCQYLMYGESIEARNDGNGSRVGCNGRALAIQEENPILYN